MYFLHHDQMTVPQLEKRTATSGCGGGYEVKPPFKLFLHIKKYIDQHKIYRYQILLLAHNRPVGVTPRSEVARS